MALIKKSIKQFWVLLEDLGRTRAAAALARGGKYELAQRVISN